MDTVKWKQDFDRDRYIFHPKFLDEQETSELAETIRRYVQEVVPTMPRDRVT